MAILSLSNVTKVFGSGEGQTRALDNVSLELDAMEVVAVMGPSGSGKTTLLTIAGALQQPTSGVVEIEGRQIQGLAQRNMAAVRRRHVGFVFQSFNLLEALTARENVQYAVELSGYSGRQAKERSISLLRMVRLEHRLDTLPKQLSGGERQRVAVARALANDARLILADEPTANLDQTSAVELLQNIRGIARELGRAIMLVTHDMRAHDFADRIFWLEDGHLSPIAHTDAHLKPHASLAASTAGASRRGPEQQAEGVAPET
jgi:putative ABC transport system ATP-binding protein